MLMSMVIASSLILNLAVVSSFWHVILQLDCRQDENISDETNGSAGKLLVSEQSEWYKVKGNSVITVWHIIVDVAICSSTFCRVRLVERGESASPVAPLRPMSNLARFLEASPHFFSSLSNRPSSPPGDQIQVVRMSFIPFCHNFHYIPLIHATFIMIVFLLLSAILLTLTPAPKKATPPPTLMEMCFLLLLLPLTVWTVYEFAKVCLPEEFW